MAGDGNWRLLDDDYFDSPEFDDLFETSVKRQAFAPGSIAAFVQSQQRSIAAAGVPVVGPSVETVENPWAFLDSDEQDLEIGDVVMHTDCNGMTVAEYRQDQSSWNGSANTISPVFAPYSSEFLRGHPAPSATGQPVRQYYEIPGGDWGLNASLAFAPAIPLGNTEQTTAGLPQDDGALAQETSSFYDTDFGITEDQYDQELECGGTMGQAQSQPESIQSTTIGEEGPNNGDAVSPHSDRFNLDEAMEEALQEYLVKDDQSHIQQVAQTKTSGVIGKEPLPIGHMMQQAKDVQPGQDVVDRVLNVDVVSQEQVLQAVLATAAVPPLEPYVSRIPEVQLIYPESETLIDGDDADAAIGERVDRKKWPARKILAGYPDPTVRSDDPPAGISAKDFCRLYPNHLDKFYLDRFMQKKITANMLIHWVPEAVKKEWKLLRICKDPLNMLNKRFVARRIKLGPDGMTWLDWSPSFLEVDKTDAGYKSQHETKGEAKGRDRTRWLDDQVKDQEYKKVKKDKRLADKLARTTPIQAENSSISSNEDAGEGNDVDTKMTTAVDNNQVDASMVL